MTKNEALKKALDCVNEGLDYFDNYIDLVSKDMSNPDEIQILKKIGIFSNSYKELCDYIIEVGGKKHGREKTIC